MWQPPQRIKHERPPGEWPSRVEAARSKWFSPVNLGPLSLEHRTWVPAMVPWRATDDGFVTPQVLGWYERLAQGQPGGLVVEATGIRDVPSGPLLRIGHDRFIPGLARLVDVVRKASGGRTRLFIQLIDFLRIRRRPDPDRFFREYLRLTQRHRQALPECEDDRALREHLAHLPRPELEAILASRELEALDFGERERVTDIHLAHIRDLPRALPPQFADAAVRAQEAGFDGVELHYAHAYTMASFLSRLNTREDGYGRTLAGRVRLPLEVYDAVRARVGSGYCVGCRFLTEEIIEGGGTVDDAVHFGLEFSRAGMDFLSLSRGGKFEDAKQPGIGEAAYPYTGQSGYECMPTVRSDDAGPFGRNVPATAAVRRRIRDAGLETAVIVTGGICSFGQAEAILAAGHADVVGAARQSLADPDWFRKVRLGLGVDVRRCKFTNYCEALDQKHRQVTCQLWDRVDLGAPDVPLASDGRRRLVAPRWQEDPKGRSAGG